MKLDKMTFAKLVKFICDLNPENWVDLEKLDELINIDVPVQSPAKANPAEVDELLRAMTDPSSYIPAIKAYRVVTGAGLKEAKEAIERFRGMKLHDEKPPVNFDKFEG